MFPQPNDYSSFFPFSPPTLNQGSLHDIFFSFSAAAEANNPPQLPPPAAAAEAAAAAAAAALEKTTSFAAPPPPTGLPRPTRKDRHRKICTANGPRDRRMRLSLDVARKFFDLQDLLAFDKASKTVQWLLNMSKSAIKEHVAASKRKAPASGCEEGISTVSDKRKSLQEPPKASKRAAAVRNMKSRTSAKPKIARECRDKARARARERTLEKKKTKMMMMMECGRQEEGSGESREPLDLEAMAFGGRLQEESSLEMVVEMDEQCFITSPVHHKEPDGNGSIAMFDYNDAVESSFQDPWEMNLSENIDERVLLGELPFQMSYGTLIIPPVFDHV